MDIVSVFCCNNMLKFMKTKKETEIRMMIKRLLDRLILRVVQCAWHDVDLGLAWDSLPNGLCVPVLESLL